jgi:hypothetical protein
LFQIFIKTTPHHRLSGLVGDPLCTALVTQSKRGLIKIQDKALSGAKHYKYEILLCPFCGQSEARVSKLPKMTG